MKRRLKAQILTPTRSFVDLKKESFIVLKGLIRGNR
jgi:hypothetical protein